MFNITWLCAVWRGKRTGHPTPFNSWLSMPRIGGMGCVVCVFMSVCLCVHVQVYACAWLCGYVYLVPALYEDPTSLQADNCTYIHVAWHVGFSETLQFKMTCMGFEYQWHILGVKQGVCWMGS
jgi:hypothetical protein